jgi:Fur family ferric uptake transcriptional regulator
MAEAAKVGQRRTRQREAILRSIQEADGPLPVPEIHDRARKSLAALGIATVYRTLKLLHDAGQIKPVILPSGETRYEKSGLGHHEHFRCRVCEQVFDLSVCPVHIPAGTILAGGFLVEDHEMTLYGVCGNCSSSNTGKTKKTTTRTPRKTKARGRKSHSPEGHTH